jgi:hypothetical protein
MIVNTPKHLESPSVLNKLLMAIILFAFVVLSLAIYTTFGGSKINISNIFLPFSGELFNYNSTPSRSYLKIIEASSYKAALDVNSNTSAIDFYEADDYLKLLLNVYQEGNPIPAQSQAWDLVKGSKSLDLEKNTYWFMNKQEAAKLEMKQDIPTAIKTGTKNTSLQSSALLESSLNHVLQKIKYWPENKQIWALYINDNKNSIVVSWNIENGKVENSFEIPKSTSMYFTEDKDTIVFNNKGTNDLLFYSASGLEKFSKTLSGSLVDIMHFKDKNFILKMGKEQVPVNLSKLTNLEREVVQVEVWDQAFLNKLKDFKTTHTKSVVMFMPIDDTNLILSAGQDTKISLLNSETAKTLEEYNVDPTRDDRNIIGGYLDRLSGQVILIYRDGDVDFYQVMQL